MAMNIKIATSLVPLAGSVITALANLSSIIDFLASFDDNLATLLLSLPPWLPLLIFPALLAIWLAAQFGLLLLIKFLLYNFDWTTKLELKFPHIQRRIGNRTFVFHRNKFKATRNAERVIKFVQEEYYRKINELDATILELIYRQKTTMAQLDKYFGLSLEHAEYRVKKMRRLELVSKEKLEIHKDLVTHFKYLPLDNFMVLDNVNTCNKPDCNNPVLTNARACQDHVCNSCQVGWKSGRSVCRSCQRWCTMAGMLGVAVIFAAVVIFFVFI